MESIWRYTRGVLRHSSASRAGKTALLHILAGIDRFRSEGLKSSAMTPANLNVSNTGWAW